MKYIGLVCEYLFKFNKGKRFLLTFLVASPVALLAAFFLPLDIYFGWFVNHVGQYESYTALLYSCFSGMNGWLYAIIFLVCTLTLAAITGMMNFCLRTGRFKIGNLLRGINDNFFSSAFVSVSYFLIGVLGHLFITFFLYPIGLINTPWLVTMLSIIVLVLFGVMMTLLATSTLMTLPIITFYGSNPFRSVGMSVSKSQADFGKLFSAVALAMIVLGALGFLMAIINIKWIAILLSYITYGFIIVYCVTLSILAFFDVEGLSREDTPKEYLYKKYR